MLINPSIYTPYVYVLNKDFTTKINNIYYLNITKFYIKLLDIIKPHIRRPEFIIRTTNNEPFLLYDKYVGLDDPNILIDDKIPLKELLNLTKKTRFIPALTDNIYKSDIISYDLIENYYKNNIISDYYNPDLISTELIKDMVKHILIINNRFKNDIEEQYVEKKSIVLLEEPIYLSDSFFDVLNTKYGEYLFNINYLIDKIEIDIIPDLEYELLHIDKTFSYEVHLDGNILVMEQHLPYSSLRLEVIKGVK